MPTGLLLCLSPACKTMAGLSEGLLCSWFLRSSCIREVDHARLALAGATRRWHGL